MSGKYITDLKRHTAITLSRAGMRTRDIALIIGFCQTAISRMIKDSGSTRIPGSGYGVRYNRDLSRFRGMLLAYARCEAIELFEEYNKRLNVTVVKKSRPFSVGYLAKGMRIKERRRIV